MSRGRPSFKNNIITHDPFDIVNHTTPQQIEWALWFADVTKNLSKPYHLRRLHYSLLGSKWPNGEEYTNTINNWGKLCVAGEYARYLGTVPYDDIEKYFNELYLE